MHVFSEKKVSSFFKNGHLFLSIFKIWKIVFIFKKHTFWVLLENAVKSQKIILICY